MYSTPSIFPQDKYFFIAPQMWSFFRFPNIFLLHPNLLLSTLDNYLTSWSITTQIIIYSTTNRTCFQVETCSVLLLIFRLKHVSWVCDSWMRLCVAELVMKYVPVTQKCRLVPSASLCSRSVSSHKFITQQTHKQTLMYGLSWTGS